MDAVSVMDGINRCQYGQVRGQAVWWVCVALTR